MATLNEVLGVATPVPMGEWQANVMYEKLNIVKYNGTTYIAKKKNSNFQPELTNGWTEVWMGIADKGDMGDIGLYHTMSPSSTTVTISSLQPQGTTPIVESAVMFPNGDVRQIRAVVGLTVTLGDVLFSYKGDPGIGNATLSNIDGDSTVNGFTQEAVKGVAQAKNTYNLGAYDSYISNGDGTATITRQTGYFKLDGSVSSWYHDTTWRNSYAFATSGAVFDGLYDSVSVNNKLIFSSRLVATSPNGVALGGVNLIGAGGDSKIFIAIEGCTTSDEINKNLSEKPIFIQFKLSDTYKYNETVIDEPSIRALSQEGEHWLRDEWEKGLNLLPESIVVASTGNLLKANYATGLPAGTYTIKLYGTPDQSGRGFQVIYSGGSSSGLIFGDSFTFSPTADNWHLQVYQLGTISDLKIMLNKGSHPYPHEPYNGNIVHQKDLSGIQLFPADINPAQTIGGDWEDLGTVTVGSTTLHAYQKIS